MPSSEVTMLREQLQAVLQRNAELESQLNHQRDPFEDNYRFIFDAMDDGFCIAELFDGPMGPLSDYRHILANRACPNHSGIPAGAGHTLRNALGAEADEWIGHYRGILLSGETRHFEQPLRHTGRYLAVTAFRVGLPSLRQVAILFQDITLRKRYESDQHAFNRHLEAQVAKALAERDLFAHLVDHSLASVLVLAPDHRLLAINSTARRLCSRFFAIEPKVGDVLFDYMHSRPAAAEKTKALWLRALAGEVFIEVATYGEAPEQYHYEMRFNLLHDREGALLGAYLFAYDITERISEQLRLRETEEALRQSQKMEAVGQLTGGIAHDFNNLLGAILGAQELMRERLGQKRHHELMQLLDTADGSAQRAAALVHRLLAFSRRQTLQPCATHVGQLVSGLEELIRRSLGPHIHLQSHYRPQLWPVLIDPHQLENALLNLCINARDAIPSGGTLCISSDNLSLDDANAQALELGAGDYLHLSVTDNGCGMPHAVAASAIDPFFTTKPLGQGTGLGLSMVYGFVRQSGGQLKVQTEVGVGTTMHLYLPRDHLASAPVADPKPSGLPLPGEPPAPRRIMLVEDEAAMRLVVSEVLDDLGHQVTVFGGSQPALKAMEDGLQVDLLICGIGLPGKLDGARLAQAVTALRPGLKVLLMTGYGANDMVHGEADILIKPFSLEALSERVKRLLEA